MPPHLRKGRPMLKPRITAAAVIAAHDVLDCAAPENYFKVSSKQQRRMRMTIVREALIAAYLADQPAANVAEGWNG